MASDLTNISTLLVNKLSAIASLNGVYDYEPAQPINGAYPFATVTPKILDGEFGDTQRNIRTYSFAIRVYQERTKAAFGNQKAERLMRSICDDILTAFDLDTQLGGGVLYVKPLKADFSYIDREIGDTRFAEFLADCVTSVTST